MNNISVGVDIEEIERFNNKTIEKDSNFLNLIYTKKELDYCFSKAKPAKHLAARYCAKEAVVKALTGFNITDIAYSDIEILNNNQGMPVAKINKYPSIDLKISLSHSKTNAIAYVLAFKE